MHTAKLVWVTPDAERLIGKLARVSNPANEDNPNVERLIKYLIKHKHWSPFEMASMCVEIQTTRAIGAQILRHRSFSFQEFSQRYAEVTEIEVPQLRRQDLDNRQNSIDDFPEELSEELQDMITLHNDKSNSLYKKLLAYGVAKECARNVLPLSTKTRMYMSGTIRSWLHYIDLRASHGTQVEHSQIARQIGDILDTELPTVSRAMWT
jgi:thymidylate synthase (FAD)